jgi:formamidopyrimidine-DNA glycosylase
MVDTPEVEVIRSIIARDLVGKKIKSVAVTAGKVVARHKTARDFRSAVEGLIVKSLDRLGRRLVLGLDNNTSLVVDLGTDSWVSKVSGEAKAKHVHVVLAMNNGPEFHFVDPTSTLEMYVAKPPIEGDGHEISRYARLAVGGEGVKLRKLVAPLAQVGLDVFEDQLGWDRFAAVVRSRPGQLLDVLTDESVLTGIGSFYAAEVLFGAGLRPDRAHDSLLSVEARRLHRTLTEIMAEAVKQGGTSIEAHPFVDPDGHGGNYGPQVMVGGRLGEPCLECRTTIVEVAGVPCCPKCQG